jgi:hypothetical protein
MNNLHLKQYDMNYLYLICLLFAGIISSLNVSAQPIPEEQINRLLEAVWKQEVNNIDAVVYLHVNTPPESEEAIRQRHEKHIKHVMDLRETLSEQQREQFNRSIQKNTERDLQEQIVGRNIKERIRIDEKKERVDSTIILPEMVLLKGTPYEEKKPATVITDDTPYKMTQAFCEIHNYMLNNDL